MKNFLKDNWFKIGLIIVLLIIACSVGYYLIIVQGQKSDIALQAECADQAAKAFKNLGYTDTDLFTDHYNHRLNKCFMEVKNSNELGLMASDLYDANELKSYADWTFGSNPPVSVCNFNGKEIMDITNCNNDSFDAFVKPYMTN